MLLKSAIEMNKTVWINFTWHKKWYLQWV